jgi:hypothetical protein
MFVLKVFPFYISCEFAFYYFQKILKYVGYSITPKIYYYFLKHMTSTNFLHFSQQFRNQSKILSCFDTHIQIL